MHMTGTAANFLFVLQKINRSFDGEFLFKNEEKNGQEIVEDIHEQVNAFNALMDRIETDEDLTREVVLELSMHVQRMAQHALVFYKIFVLVSKRYDYHEVLESLS